MGPLHPQGEEVGKKKKVREERREEKITTQKDMVHRFLCVFIVFLYGILNDSTNFFFFSLFFLIGNSFLIFLCKCEVDTPSNGKGEGNEILSCVISFWCGR